jgi:hypothetical protein
VLSDAQARRDYDASLGARCASAGGATEGSAMALQPPTPVPAPPRATLPPLPASPGLVEGFEDVEGAVDASSYDGARLRRSRLQRGLDLDHIAAVTKINPTYLRLIEEERFEDLPAQVYVRGFVTAYAKCVGLDPAVVTPSYMTRFEAGGSGRKRGRLSGRG